MAKWKAAGHMAVVMRDAERQAELRRVEEERRQETIKGGKILRKIARSRAKVGNWSTNLRSRCERVYDMVNKQNDNHSDDLRVAKSTYHQRRDAMYQEALMDNIERLDNFREERRKTAEALEVLKVKTRTLDAELFDAKKRLKKMTVYYENVRVDSALKTWRRVELVQQKIGLQLTENQRLKDMIDHLQGERDKIMSVHTALDTDLNRLSRKLTVFTEEAKGTYAERDFTLINIDKLKNHLKNNTFSFESDMQHLQFRIDCLQRMERFMTTKSKFRPTIVPMSVHKKRSQPSVMERENQGYDNLMRKIEEDLQGEDLHRIIQMFIELEQENYVLFKNISETLEECYVMESKINEAQVNHKQLVKDDLTKEQENMARKVELVEKIQNCRQQAHKAEKHIAAADKVIGVYIEQTVAIMDKLGYNQEDFRRLSGVLGCVEERNVSLFLAEIEHYVQHLFSLKAAADYMSWHEARMSGALPERLPSRLPLVRRMLVEPPIHEEGDDLDDPVLPVEASFRPLDGTDIEHHLEEDLESQARADPTEFVNLPSPVMTDPANEVIGHHKSSKPHRSIDVV